MCRHAIVVFKNCIGGVCSWRFLCFHQQAELHRDRIYGAHIAEYMEYLTEEDEAKYKEHFAEYIKNEITFEDVEDMYKVGRLSYRRSVVLSRCRRPSVPSEYHTARRAGTGFVCRGK